KTKVLTLVGLNESGKTSILEAIDFFQADVPTRERYKLIPKSEKIDFNGKVSVVAEFKLSDADNKKVEDFAKEHGYKKLEPITKLEVTKNYTFINSTFEGSENLWTIHLEGIKKGAVKSRKIEHGISSECHWQKI